MLDSLDVLIGFALVMLVLSTGVTLLTQMAANLVNLRGQTLRSGVSTLLRQIDPGLEPAMAEKIATAALEHPLVAAPASWLGRRLPQAFGAGLGTVVSREELVQILLSLAGGGPPAGSKLIPDDARTKLREALAKAGVTDPAATLTDIQMLALKLEQAHPDWAAHVRAGAASIGVAAGRYTATLHAWFDNGMERVRDSFVARLRWVTVGCALVVTLAVPVDSVRLLRCLWVDPELRKALAAQGLAAAEQEQPPSAASWAAFSKQVDDLRRVAAGASPGAKADLDARLVVLQQAAAQQEQKARTAQAAAPARGCSAETLIEPGAIAPRSWAWPWRWSWPSRWPANWTWPAEGGAAVPGLVLTWMLLSLGAPFWFDALKSLAKLRPTLAGPEDRERAGRASGRPQAPPAGGAPGPPPPAGGEAGDLGATGAAG